MPMNSRPRFDTNLPISTRFHWFQAEATRNEWLHAVPVKDNLPRVKRSIPIACRGSEEVKMRDGMPPRRNISEMEACAGS